MGGEGALGPGAQAWGSLRAQKPRPRSPEELLPALASLLSICTSVRTRGPELACSWLRGVKWWEMGGRTDRAEKRRRFAEQAGHVGGSGRGLALGGQRDPRGAVQVEGKGKKGRQLPPEATHQGSASPSHARWAAQSTQTEDLVGPCLRSPGPSFPHL